MIKKIFKKELCLEKILLLLISVFVFFTMYYYDNQTTFVEILKNMHRIASGQWYYIFNGWSAIPYGLLLQGVCAIWSLPVFILSELGLISITSVGARLWYKIFVLIFLLLDTQQLEVMARKLGTFSEKKKFRGNNPFIHYYRSVCGDPDFLIALGCLEFVFVFDGLGGSVQSGNCK